MQFYCYKNQRDLTARLSFAWEMHDAPRMEAMSAVAAWDTLCGAREQSPCLCQDR